jgi:RNA polymerase sigma-70 factor (ECF subfamily)
MAIAWTPEQDESDPELVRRARAGSHSAFVRLVDRYRDRVYRLAWRISGNPSDAEEILQEAFLHAFRGLPSFHGDAAFGTWLYRIAMNEALMRKRYAKRRPVTWLDALRPGLADRRPLDGEAPMPADALVDGKAVAQQVRAALDRLDVDQRAALVLRDMEGLSAEECASVLGVSAETVRQRAHRARLKMRGLLAGLAPGGR